MQLKNMLFKNRTIKGTFSIGKKRVLHYTG
jgi:hypothetical protein